MSALNVLVQSAKPFQRVASGVWPSTIRRPGHIISKTTQGKPVTVGRLLSQVQSTPNQTMLLGQCTEGLPVFMGLDDPLAGAVLIIGENSCGRTHQLQVMVDSAIRRHSPEKLRISILTLHPEEWATLKKDIHQQKYLKAIHAWYDRGSEILIRKIMNSAEMRRDGQPYTAHHMILLDDLNFIEYLSYESQMNLHWLLTYGAQLGFTMVATLNTVYASNFRYWVDIFRTRIFGRNEINNAADRVAMHPGLETKSLATGSFRVFSEGDWLTYQLPMLGD
jgi:hypothetical protein